MSDTPPPPEKSWPDYRAVWRWHFYAGLFCIPFVVILATSGAIYLFKPQIEAWNDRPYDTLQLAGPPASSADQIRAAVASVPGSTLKGYELPTATNTSARVVVTQDGEDVRVYVHPETLEVLHSVPEDERFMRVLFRLHGELLMGDRGSNLVELAASWTIIMIVTGLYLWWPRNAQGLGGIVYPRLTSGSRIFWRDIHSVTGVWVSAFALFLLASGLPWAKSWGAYFKQIRAITGTAVAQQDWTTGSSRATRGEGGGSGEHGGHGGSSRKRGEAAPMPKDLTAVNRIVATVAPLKLAAPVVIAPPKRGSSDWTAKSMAANRPLRVNLVVNGHTGEIISHEDFGDRHLIDRIVGTCVAAHEGQLFGWPNQALGLLTALGLILLCVSGVVMWWRRRDQGVLGAPKVLANPRFSIGLAVLVVALGIYLPMFGVSLLFVLLLEKAILSRIPRVRDWLGLYDVSGSPATLRTASVIALLSVAAGISGCGGARPVTGGTEGTLRAGGEAISDVQVTMHEAEGATFHAVGFAVTGLDGRFQLVTSGAKGPLRLAAGEYRCTLESAGAPVEIPPEYAKPETSPLKIVWSAGDRSLNLEINPAR